MLNPPQSERHELFRVYPCAERALWSPKLFSAVERAETFGELVPIAMTILGFFEEEVTIVSGPISTGGFGSRKLNIKVFTNAIGHLQVQGRSVFDQTPFETAIFRLASQWHRSHPEADYCMPILDDFYGPVFASGFISRVAFIHDWQSSRGAQWERRKALELGLAIDDLPLITP